MPNPTDTTAHWKILQKISTVKLNISPYSIQFSKSRESERERKWGYTSTATPTVKSSLHRCKFPGNLSPATFLLFAPQNRALHVYSSSNTKTSSLNRRRFLAFKESQSVTHANLWHQSEADTTPSVSLLLASLNAFSVCFGNSIRNG